MKEKLLTRDEFKTQVFKRDKFKCVFCEKAATDAHHILDRKLWTDGGYYLTNGVSVCETHHWSAEKTDISVKEIREKLNIRVFKLPADMISNIEYDKWGNIVTKNGRIPGKLYLESNVQKVLKDKLYLFNKG